MAATRSYAREVFITQSSTFVKVRETPLLFFVFLLLSSLFLDFRSIPEGKEEIHAPLCLGLFWQSLVAPGSTFPTALQERKIHAIEHQNHLAKVSYE
jgi:hypothetical protein